MKLILLALLISVGCSTTKNHYNSSEVSYELKKNASQLETLVQRVEKDYSEKESFFVNYRKEVKDKNSFIVQDLGYRLVDLKNKKDIVLARSNYLNGINDSLLAEVNGKKYIQEEDVAYKKIKTFSDSITVEAKDLYRDYSSYKTASDEFGKFAFFSGSIWKKSTSAKKGGSASDTTTRDL